MRRPSADSGETSSLPPGLLSFSSAPCGGAAGPAGLFGYCLGYPSFPATSASTSPASKISARTFELGPGGAGAGAGVTGRSSSFTGHSAGGAVETAAADGARPPISRTISTGGGVMAALAASGSSIGGGSAPPSSSGGCAPVAARPAVRLVFGEDTSGRALPIMLQRTPGDNLPLPISVSAPDANAWAGRLSQPGNGTLPTDPGPQQQQQQAQMQAQAQAAPAGVAAPAPASSEPMPQHLPALSGAAGLPPLPPHFLHPHPHLHSLHPSGPAPSAQVHPSHPPLGHARPCASAPAPAPAESAGPGPGRAAAAVGPAASVGAVVTTGPHVPPPQHRTVSGSTSAMTCNTAAVTCAQSGKPPKPTTSQASTQPAAPAQPTAQSSDPAAAASRNPASLPPPYGPGSQPYGPMPSMPYGGHMPPPYDPYGYPYGPYGMPDPSMGYWGMPYPPYSYPPMPHGPGPQQQGPGQQSGQRAGEGTSGGAPPPPYPPAPYPYMYSPYGMPGYPPMHMMHPYKPGGPAPPPYPSSSGAQASRPGMAPPPAAAGSARPGAARLQPGAPPPHYAPPGSLPHPGYYYPPHPSQPQPQHASSQPGFPPPFLPQPTPAQAPSHLAHQAPPHHLPLQLSQQSYPTQQSQHPQHPQQPQAVSEDIAMVAQAFTMGGDDEDLDFNLDDIELDDISLPPLADLAVASSTEAQAQAPGGAARAAQPWGSQQQHRSQQGRQVGGGGKVRIEIKAEPRDDSAVSDQGSADEAGEEVAQQACRTCRGRAAATTEHNVVASTPEACMHTAAPPSPTFATTPALLPTPGSASACGPHGSAADPSSAEPGNREPSFGSGVAGCDVTVLVRVPSLQGSGPKAADPAATDACQAGVSVKAEPVVAEAPSSACGMEISPSPFNPFSPIQLGAWGLGTPGPAHFAGFSPLTASNPPKGCGPSSSATASTPAGSARAGAGQLAKFSGFGLGMGLSAGGGAPRLDSLALSDLGSLGLAPSVDMDGLDCALFLQSPPPSATAAAALGMAGAL
ncbi:hypothetical protein HYH03_006374 [Edaphochlamys debaryana]|uniref:Uncharacterized protein n=1 Tax=Edaphochlamys debaryana TaxID=47281 RepID=A0A835Y5D4_9CHLO|nr:hypothetical protein HYH03_006374 [Edaphochlamys debaryana]|eukprot:KAG2495427.1 hypothetical protein HYH03_006374 [Edaphochlamys debaryana]